MTTVLDAFTAAFLASASFCAALLGTLVAAAIAATIGITVVLLAGYFLFEALPAHIERRRKRLKKLARAIEELSP